MSVRNLFEAAADRYDEGAQESRYVGPRWLEGQLQGLPPVNRVLDLGCANGALGSVIRRRYPNAELVGIDVSPRMVAAAKQKDIYNELYVADLEQPLAVSSEPRFDLAVALGFLEFLVEPAKLLVQVWRAMCPQGVLFASFQQHWPERPELAPRRTRSGVVPHHAYTDQEVVAMLTEAGFAVDNVDSKVGYVSRSGFSCPYLFCRCKRVERET